MNSINHIGDIWDAIEALSDDHDEDPVLGRIVAEDGTTWHMAVNIATGLTSDGRGMVIEMRNTALKTLPQAGAEQPVDQVFDRLVSKWSHWLDQVVYEGVPVHALDYRQVLAIVCELKNQLGVAERQGASSDSMRDLEKRLGGK